MASVTCSSPEHSIASPKPSITTFNRPSLERISPAKYSIPTDLNIVSPYSSLSSKASSKFEPSSNNVESPVIVNEKLILMKDSGGGIYSIPSMIILGEWLIYEKEGLLIYISQFGYDSVVELPINQSTCRLSIETSSNSTASYDSILIEISSLKGIEAIIEKPSCTGVSGNERMFQVIRFKVIDPTLALRFRLRISFKVVYDSDDSILNIQEDVVDFVSPVGN